MAGHRNKRRARELKGYAEYAVNMSPNESMSWIEGDLLEFDGPEDIRLRFVRLDPNDPIGFYAADLGAPGEPVSGSWTRGRFRKVPTAGGSEP